MSVRRPLEDKLAALLANRESASRLRRLTLSSPDSIDFSSNSYLSLSSVPEVRRAFLSLLESYQDGSSALGSGGSRLLDGNTTLAESLETDLARFHRAPAGLLFNSGFDANVGLFSCLPQPGDVIVYDELIHASTHDGMKLSRAGRKLAFRHNCVEKNNDESGEPAGSSLECLDRVLDKLVNGEQGDTGVATGKTNVFVAVEGVYSMDGDVAPLSEIVACVERHLPHGNGCVIVDEAHSTGLFGAEGRGLVCELGLEDRVFARLHTFGKAMGSSGAVVLCSPVTRQYLINYARTLIYTTAMPPVCLASIKVTYDFLASGRAEVLRDQLRSRTVYAHHLLHQVCSRRRAPPELLRLAPDTPKSPIIPLLTSRPRSLAKYCQENKLMVRPVVAPTVPKGSERVRICIHATNLEEEIEALVRTVDEWLQSQLKDDKESRSRL